jgi:pyruvyltransferase
MASSDRVLVKVASSLSRTKASWSSRAQRVVKDGWAFIRQNKVVAFWSSFPNFGDQITPVLLRHYGFTPDRATSAGDAQLVSTGSLLQWIPEDFDGLIVGTGLIQDEPRRFPHARILAVRGQLTAERIGAPPGTVLGDPGILASTLVKRPRTSQTVGLIPHYVDQEHPAVAQLLRNYPKEIRVIDVRRPPVVVFRDIASCEHILSSSLHGLITADSFGIRSRWLHFSDNVIGQGFKFHDYFSSIGVTDEPHVITGSERLADLLKSTRHAPPCIGERIEQLRQVFSSLRQFL